MAPATLSLPPQPSNERAGSSEDLQRYRRGEITEAEYLAGRIEEATRHLKGRVSPERLQMLKEVITRKLETDPLLIEARSRLLDDANAPNGTGSKSNRQ